MKGGLRMLQRYAGLEYEQVVRKYADTVFAVCVMRVNNTADAEDCFQNTFLKLYTDPPVLRDTEHLKAWLIRVAINQCKNWMRDSRRAAPLDEALRTPLRNIDDERDISWALMLLEPKYREVLYLYYIERYKVAEIGEILDMKPNTVKTVLSRGREKLRRLYGGDEG